MDKEAIEWNYILNKMFFKIKKVIDSLIEYL